MKTRRGTAATYLLTLVITAVGGGVITRSHYITADATLPESADGQSVTVKVIPERPYIERSEFTQHLNFDFQFQNLTESKLRLGRIQVSVFDRRDRLVLRKFISARGSSMPAIYTLPNRDLDRKGPLGVFNPFHTFDADIPITALRYDFVFDVDGSAKQYTSSITLKPIPYRAKVDLILPLKVRAIVYDGHDYYSHHRRIDLSNPGVQAMGLADNPVRYAYDFSVVNDEGELYAHRADRPEDWFGYGAAVYAPGTGKVVSVRNDVPDNAIIEGRLVPPEGGPRDQKSRLLGNHVVIDHGSGEYSLLAHLKAGSMAVGLNEEVKQGQMLGKIGFSGDTGFHVHVHYHLATGMELAGSQALSSYFSNFRRIFGSEIVRVRKGRVDSGEIVEPLK